MLNKHNIFTLGILTLVSLNSYAAIDSKGNIAEGQKAGKNTDGKTNIALSNQAGQNVKGDNNIALAFKSGNNVNGSNNTAIGRAAGSDVEGSLNTAQGYGTGQKVTGYSNISSGTYSGVKTEGHANISNGAYAGQSIKGNGNIATGNAAGVGIKGDNNIAIGNAAGTSADVDYLTNGTHKPKSNLDDNTINTPKRSINRSVSVGTKAISMEDDAVSLGSYSRSDIAKGKEGFLAEGDDVQNATWKSTHAGVSIGKDSEKPAERITRQIHNLAAGTKDTDAVNVAQLRKINTKVDKNAQGLSELNANIANLKIDFHHLENRLNTITSDLKAGIAGSTAIANLPQAFRHGQSMISVAVGSYRGQSAAAFGISRMAENSSIVFKASGRANTQGHFNVGAGIGWGW
ncbi:YadA family autotransporter adhesin [Pasteurella multocida]|uniref:YadA family autotransporter adhesin n=1 Tax=Pasteurella multocida TaxID=747 RepID=UPI0039796E67